MAFFMSSAPAFLRCLVTYFTTEDSQNPKLLRWQNSTGWMASSL